MTAIRDDFFLLIHKAQRRELFAITAKAGSLDWGGGDAAHNFAGSWNELRRVLETHARHEDNHFLPLLASPAPQILLGVEAAHRDLAVALEKLTAMIDQAAAAPSPPRGLAVYRQMSEFVAHYLLHLLEEETVVMPAIWALCTDEEISYARQAFLADQTPAGAVRTRRIVLPAVSPVERAIMAATSRDGDSAKAFTAFMDDAKAVLAEPDWDRLQVDLTT